MWYVCHLFHVFHDVCNIYGRNIQIGHGVLEGPVEWGGEAGGMTTLPQYELIMHQLIAN